MLFFCNIFFKCTWTEVLHIHVHYCLFVGHGQYELEVAASVSTRALLESCAHLVALSRSITL
jgi:hypothetical protein